MAWLPISIVETLRRSHDLGIFLRVATSPALHVWLGVNNVPIGFDGIDPSGTVYLGGGRLIGIPTLEILVNGTADSVDFTISGIDPATGGKMLDSIPAVRGCEIHMGITTLDQYWQPMTSIIPLWQGRGSHVSEASPTVMGRDDATLSLSLSVVTGEPTRSRPARVLWSDAMQKSISPDDDFCKQTARIARGVQPKWPNY